jgi:DNA polymerase-3 subunit epsilon
VNKKLLVIDTETTGTDPAVHSILSFAVVIYDNGSICGSFKTLVLEPGVVIEPGAFAVNGITREMIADAPGPTLAVQLFKNWLKENNLHGRQQIVGHNAAFDAGFLKRLWRLAGQDYEDQFSHRLLCTQTAALLLEQAGRLVLPGGSASLDAVADVFGLTRSTEKHDALEDALLSAQVLRKMMERLK